MSISIKTNIESFKNQFENYDNILLSAKDDFLPHIIERGESYYRNGNVVEVIKYGNKYKAKVRGTKNAIYDVYIDNNEELYYDCDCPYENNCKHEYAVLIAIANHDYKEVEVKPEIKEIDFDLYTLIEKIPAEEIKNHLLHHINNNTIEINRGNLEEDFRKYYPKQEYEFYYNNLYNELVMEEDGYYLTNEFLSRVKQYIDHNEFTEGYKIINSIIEAYHDTNHINDYNFVDLFPRIGMYLRIIYRKSDEQTKNLVNQWINELEIKNYYYNYYLEDMIYTLR